VQYLISWGFASRRVEAYCYSSYSRRPETLAVIVNRFDARKSREKSTVFV